MNYQDAESLNPFLRNNGVLYFQGAFFIELAAIKQNDPFVQKAFAELYQYIRKN